MIGVILAGGASTRFGSNKALHKIEGKPFYEHVYEAFKESDVSRIVLSTNKMMTAYFESEIKEKQSIRAEERVQVQWPLPQRMDDMDEAGS